MKVTVTVELRFDVMPDGSVWTLSNFHAAFWDRYLKVYDRVEIVARANPVTEIKPNSRRVDAHEKISFRPLPFYLGPWGYLKKLREIKILLKEIERESDAVILRLPSPIADLMLPYLKKSGRPYGVEVVGNPLVTFAKGSYNSPFRSFFRWWGAKKLKEEVAHASAISYVTSIVLPEFYPGRKGTEVIYASSIELFEHQLIKEPKVYDPNKKIIKLVSVGVLESWGKGPDIAIRAIKRLKDSGIETHLTWIGDGVMRTEVENLARTMGVDQNITFRGQLPSGDAIFKELDAADIFIFPSRGEGLPRAMIEAMARGLVCVGTEVGGIPELISSEFMHSAGDDKKLYEILKNLIAHPERLTEIGETNWKKSKDYLAPVLNERRTGLYQRLKEMTHAWKNSSGR